jgi:hypothetical protein
MIRYLAFALTACGSGSQPAAGAKSHAASRAAGGQSDAGRAGARDATLAAMTGPAGEFDPPPPAAGYTRIEVPVLTDLPPGSDTLHCQYVRGPSDRDLDILDVQGYQSAGGHHSVAYSTTVMAPVGTDRPCNADDNMQAGFLGGIGGEGSGAVKLPEGVAYRLPKGSSIMLNTHFLNTGSDAIDGHTVLDFQFVEVDPGRTIASLFSNGDLSFKVAPGAAADATATCTLPRDMQFILFTNHMHDQGSHAKTELLHADGSVELVHEDPSWSYEMQFNATFSAWPLTAPLAIARGETLRTQCHWQNTTVAELAFPREMCFGVGFFLSDGSSAPVCLDGSWLER